MSTLIEIEDAVERLPHREQEILLEHLAHKLRAMLFGRLYITKDGKP